MNWTTSQSVVTIDGEPRDAVPLAREDAVGPPRTVATEPEQLVPQADCPGDEGRPERLVERFVFPAVEPHPDGAMRVDTVRGR